jgi:hypothetical protein
VNRGDTWIDPSAKPSRTLTSRTFGKGDSKPFRTFTVERCRFTTVGALRNHYADRQGAESIPGGIRFTQVIDPGPYGTIVNELTLNGGN